MSNDFSGFNKENVGDYFKELSKEIKKEFVCTIFIHTAICTKTIRL